jgi:hypothetical protein
MAGATSIKVLSLYKRLLRESAKFNDNNYRSYAIRRVRDGFKQCTKETEPVKIDANISYAKNSLEIIKRQSTIGNLFGSL